MSVYFALTCSKDLKENNCYKIQIYMVTWIPIASQRLDKQVPRRQILGKQLVAG
jgi:hypothetical protein